MGYSHGRNWTDEDIRNEVLAVMNTLGLSRLPTKKECDLATGNMALSNVVSKRCGWYNLAKELGLEIKQSETTTGKFGESIAANLLSEKGFLVQRMSQNHPFDLLINGIAKIDVKTSRLYRGRNGDFYAFNLGKKYHSCDFFLLLELDDNDNPLKSMIVPARDVMEINQISCGVTNSIYDKYIDCFFYIDELLDFWKGRIQ